MSDERYQAAVEHLRLGRKQEARQLLLNIVQENELHEKAWLLLSVAMAEPPEQLTALRNALYLNPNNSKARQRLVALLTKSGAEAFKNGRKKEARLFLQEALEYEHESEKLWLWLSKLSETIEERISALENAQRLNPDNKATTEALNHLRAIAADQVKLASYYTQRGDQARAAAVYHKIILNNSQGQQELARKKLIELREDELTAAEPIQPPSPTYTLIRLMLGPSLLYTLLLLLHAGLNPLYVNPTLVAAGLVILFGSFLMVGTRMTPEHLLWIKIFGVHGLQRPLRLGIWVTGFVCVALPFMILLLAAWQRYHATAAQLP